VEVYPAIHGWMLIDSKAYDAAAAERAWGRMSALFATL
jgi:carboxymethylenebutenolidase